MTRETTLINRQELDNQNPIPMTQRQLAEWGRNLVLTTLTEMGLKPHRLQSGKIYRSEMVEIIGRWEFEKARRNGKLRTFKNTPTKKNSMVYARRSDWEKFLRECFNNENK